MGEVKPRDDREPPEHRHRGEPKDAVNLFAVDRQGGEGGPGRSAEQLRRTALHGRAP